MKRSRLTTKFDKEWIQDGSIIATGFEKLQYGMVVQMVPMNGGEWLLASRRLAVTVIYSLLLQRYVLAVQFDG